VDDTPDDVLLLVELLKGACRVRVASSGAKALEIAGSEDPPDLILLDVMMPEMDGYAVCRQLKRDLGTREIPVLFLTGKSELQDEARGLAAGAADYIAKPFSPALVLARVRTHLEQGRLLKVERELLEKTLKGFLAAILELISLADPGAVAWSQRLAELAEAVALRMGLEEPWMVGLAGALSRIGALSVPEPVLAKVKAGSHLTAEERQAYNRVPEVGYRLLKGIPRLDGVAEMVYYCQKDFNGGGYPSDQKSGREIPQGARILRQCLDFMSTGACVRDPVRGISDLLSCQLSSYDPDVTHALKKVIHDGFFSTGEGAGRPASEEICIRDLLEGQMLDRSIETDKGRLLFRQGTVLGPGHIGRLAQFERIGAIRGPVLVRTSGWKEKMP
jgi:putative two-component system response regulator